MWRTDIIVCACSVYVNSDHSWQYRNLAAELTRSFLFWLKPTATAKATATTRTIKAGNRQQMPRNAIGIGHFIAARAHWGFLTHGVWSGFGEQ